MKPIEDVEQAEEEERAGSVDEVDRAEHTHRGMAEAREDVEEADRLEELVMVEAPHSLDTRHSSMQSPIVAVPPLRCTGIDPSDFGIWCCCWSRVTMTRRCRDFNRNDL